MASNIYLEQILKSLKKVTGIETIMLDIPEREEFGDYSSNIALKLKSQNSKVKNKTQNLKFEETDNPHQIAQNVVEKLKKDKDLMHVVEKIEIAGPGFINFFLNTDVLLSNLIHIVSEPENFGKSDFYKNKKVCVEYTDPNPFKEFHIGHLISNITGESICRIFEANGAKVWRADYYGDVGVHVAKSIWGIKKNFQEDNITLSDLEKKDLLEKVAYMGTGYAMGSRAYESDEKAKEEIEKLNTVLYICSQKTGESQGRKSTVNYDPEKKVSDEEINAVFELYVKGRSWSLEYLETIYHRLGTKFDGYYPESVVGEVGFELVKENIGRVFEESEGAVVFKGERFGLHTRVFINKHNLPTYEAKELGLAPSKYKDFQYDKSVIVVGKEIKEYFEVLVQALKLVEPKLGNVTEPICTGMVSVPGGKMGSRFGNVITVTGLLNQLKDIINERYLNTGYTEEEKEEISEEVAQGALKYAFLKNSIGSDFIFDINASVSLEGNSGPYLQYTYARTQSVLTKSKVKTQKSKPGDFSNLELNSEELAVLRHLSHYTDIIAMSVKNYSPNLICNYLYELAQKFNTFYNKHKIIQNSKFKTQNYNSKFKNEKNSRPDNLIGVGDIATNNTEQFRLALTSATGTVL
ncbi:MAG: Arginine-tRNA ligase, partial [Candidatus Woesebacteria bacterium GW2011_GWA1_39_21]